MAKNFIIFDWVPEFIRQQILELVGEDYTPESLDDLADDLRSEMHDMKLQIKTVEARAKLDNRLESEEYLDWLERINTRLRIKTAIYGAITYNLKKLKQEEIKLQNHERLEKLENLVRHIMEEQDKRYQRTQKRFESIQGNFDRNEKQKSFIYRCLHHLLLRDGVRTDEESLLLEEWLSFIPSVVEKCPDYGKFPD